MTAIARRRTRNTIVAAVLSVVLILLASAMAVVGAVTLSNSREGEAVGVDERPRVTFPATPNAVLAVVGDDGELASLVVMTLLPAGQGGSIVTVPVNADSTAGFGMQRRPIDEFFEADDVESLVGPVEEMLSITIQRAEIVDAEGLEALLAPIESLEVVLPRDVHDSSTATQGGRGEVDDANEADVAGGADASDASDDDTLVAAAGPQTLTRSEVVEVLTAVDDEGAAYDHHEVDVEMWAALAQSAPITTPAEAVDVDADGRPVAPSTVGEFVTRLWEGEVGVRDLGVVTLVATDNPTDADVVLLDRRDTALVFAQISPALVSTPTSGLNVRVVAQYTDDQLAQSDGLFDTTSDLLRGFIAQMLVLENNVISVDAIPDGAPDVTIIEVTDERWLAETQTAAEALFGQAEVRLAETVLEGVDIQVTLGMTYIVREMVRAEPGEGATAPVDTTPGDDTPDGSTPDVTTGDPDTTGTVVDDG